MFYFVSVHDFLPCTILLCAEFMRRAPANGKNRSSALLRGLMPAPFRTHDAADPQSVDAHTLINIGAYRLRRRTGADPQPFRGILALDLTPLRCTHFRV